MCRDYFTVNVNQDLQGMEKHAMVGYGYCRHSLSPA